MNSPAPEPNLLALFARPLHDAGLRYLIAGSVGAMHYSEPRLTIDIDIPILLTPRDISTLSHLFPEPDYYCPPADIIASEIALTHLDFLEESLKTHSLQQIWSTFVRQ